MKHTITFDDVALTLLHKDGGVALTDSTLGALDVPANAAFNRAVDALESMVSAHLAAGMDVTCPAYVEGLKTAYTALCDREDPVDCPPSHVVVVTSSRMTSIVDSEQYTAIPEHLVNAQGEALEAAVECAQEEETAMPLGTTTNLDEVMMVHEQEFSLD